ncbi:MAG: phage terminase large subunit family protein [Clostridia bacterium]|nr:phage terminase large subunit family protein [Clostridia bacterium]
MATTKRTDADRLNAAISRAIAGIRPPEQLTVSQWADKKRKLSQESSAEVGQWRTSRTPYLKDIMDAFNDPVLRHIAVVASSQVGKSECINNMIGYIIDQDPGSILFIQPTTIDAKDYSKLRIAPMIRDTKCLKNKVADPKSRESANTILQKSYPGGILTMCGSTEAHALCSKPIRYIFGDERDRWATSAGNEGDPWELATARQITFYNAKSVEVSTPTVKGASAIERAYGDGTMERWKTRCPHCEEYSEITFENIRFEYETTEVGNDKVYDITEIHYVCPCCGGVSSEREIKAQPSKWVADNPDAYKQHQTRSFWLSSWVSPWASWKSTILQYLKAIGNSKKMQVVYNTRFGLLWEDRGDLEDEESVMARREDYGTNEDGSPVELPEGVLYLTCGVDTQDDRLEYEVVGYGHFDESWGIKKGIIMGRPDTDEVWQRLDDIIDHVYRFKSGIGLRVSTTFVDEGGHFTQDVRMRCRERLAKKVFAIKGRGGQDIPFTSPPKKQKIVVNGRALGMCWVYEIGVDAGKQLIMDNLRVQSPGSKYCHFPRRDDYGPTYFKGLLSERLVYKNGHKHPWQWEKIPGHERNEPLDCRDYANAAKKAASPDMDAIERRLRGTTPNTQTPVATPPNRPQTAHKPQRKGNKLKKYYDDW